MKEITLEKFNKEIKKSLQKDLGCASIMAVPKLEKIVLNCGLGEAKNNKNIINEGLKAIETIAGQKALQTLVKKSEASFKIREGMPIGVKVTLRRDKMYDFLSRLVNVYIPRFRDFKGLSLKSFDEGGSYSIGINDMRVFPELTGVSLENVPGMSVTIVTTAKNKDEGLSLLKTLGLPFKKS